ncbi:MULTISPECIES: HK97 family phage prohead protease [Bacteroides]|jgi:HK97 family phage prohead protease|uniref:HK97 family phage prohead protease n=1 Tax=Bacteroides TaxID=816 RepID=UPI00164B1F87|nr:MULTISPECIES: HK97 family phage prohead protease [Bacteroides]MBC5614293.1 HK97 family phage prohead protease [Bacteroides hominis (ex Liu et al. 2022)]MBW9277669.1 HK97 family phage prohead protease [Bacteroides fragilis]MCS2829714.1 HK97 family phage prohead protease [Bacteroides fragilis]
MEIRSFTDLGTPKITEGRNIEGYAIVFDQESRVIYDPVKKLAFIEIIERGAVTDELIRACDIKAVLEHDKRRLLARSRYGVGSLSLGIDNYGLGYKFSSPKTTDGDFAVEMIDRGDIYGSSFAYYVDDRDKSKVTYSKRDGMIIRTVHKIDYISDVSPVSDPAYFGTDVTVRSLNDIPDLLKRDNSDYLIELETLKKLI